MTEILLPSPFALNPFMGSQAGNLQDFTAYPGHTIIGSEAEPDSSSRQEFAQPPSLASDMGLRYIPIPAADDVRFSPDSGTANSPVYSIEPTVQTSTSSALTFSPYTNVYQQGPLSGSTAYSSASNNYFPPNTSLFSMPDVKPRLSSLSNAPPGMSRSPALPQLASPHNTRDLYSGTTPSFRRASDLTRSPSALGPVRGAPLSPTESRSGFTSPTTMDSLGVPGQGSPPLHPTEVHHQFQTADGQIIKPEIFGKIDKGFFMADNDWTCYRRNYFALNCSYTLHPHIPTGALHLLQNGGSSPVIYAFAMSIAAVVDSRNGKSIELVQHTPKRDKGPQDKPPRITVAPRPHPSIGMYGGDNGLGNGSRGVYDQFSGSSPGQTAMEATFERIQFKNATANNGKRRAAQQYYHLLVELFADLGQQHQDRWVKVATRMSAPMVVRGRSPGHYQSERRESNASIGPGGSGGGGGGGSGTFSPGNGSSRGPSDMGSVSTSMLSSSSYGTSYNDRSHHYARPTPLHIPMEPTMSSEDARGIEESPGYLYYPAVIYEGQESRYQLPRLSEEPRIKQEYNSNGYILPSLTGSHDGYNRHCGRWEGVTDSKGYFPTTLLQHEMSMT